MEKDIGTIMKIITIIGVVLGVIGIGIAVYKLIMG